MKQVRLALPRRALEVERRELRRFQRGHALCGIDREHVGGARNEFGEGQRRIKPGNRGIGAERRGSLALHRSDRPGVVGGHSAHPQFRHGAAARVDGDPDLAHFRTRDLPRERQPVGKPIGHPVRGKLGRQEQVERAGFLAKRADLNRLDPLAVQLRAKILFQALADIGPICRKIERFLVLDHRVFTYLSPWWGISPLGCGAPTAAPCKFIHFHAPLSSTRWPATASPCRRHKSTPHREAPLPPAMKLANVVTPKASRTC